MRHKFVELIPNKLEQETLYVSVEYKTVVHLCACGCGKEVITPITPTDWSLIFNGVGVSLHPSIGNWDFKCRSHYWIKNNNVIWAEQWTDEEIASTKREDSSNKDRYYKDNVNVIKANEGKDKEAKQGFLSKLYNLFFAKDQY